MKKAGNTRIIRYTTAMHITIAMCLLWTAPLNVKSESQHSEGHRHNHQHARQWHCTKQAICVIHPTQGNTASGIVRFLQIGNGVRIIANISGLTANSSHAIHVHQFGDCSSPDGKSAGGHYNPEGNPHALPTSDIRHAGDLGNLQTDVHGVAHYDATVGNLSVAGFRNPILGRSVIIHGKADDGGQPTGNAGPRIGCGVIGIAKSTVPATQPK